MVCIDARYRDQVYAINRLDLLGIYHMEEDFQIFTTPW